SEPGRAPGAGTLLVGLLGNLALPLLEEPVVVVADGTDGQAARTVAEGADHAKQPLPDAEPLVARERSRLGLGTFLADESAEDSQDRREAELLCKGRAQALVEPPVLDRVGRARIEATRAGLADAELLGQLAVGLEHRVGEDDGRVAARAGFFREQIQLQADRAEPGLDRHVTRREIAVARALHLPDGFLRGRLKRPVVVFLDEPRDPIADAIHLAEHELIDGMAARVVRA